MAREASRYVPNAAWTGATMPVCGGFHSWTALLLVQRAKSSVTSSSRRHWAAHWLATRVASSTPSPIPAGTGAGASQSPRIRAITSSAHASATNLPASGSDKAGSGGLIGMRDVKRWAGLRAKTLPSVRFRKRCATVQTPAPARLLSPECPKRLASAGVWCLTATTLRPAQSAFRPRTSDTYAPAS